MPLGISTITGRPLPSEKEKFKASNWLAGQLRLPSPGERVPGVWPLEMTPSKWISKKDPGYTGSLYNPPKMLDPIAGMVDFKGFKPKVSIERSEEVKDIMDFTKKLMSKEKGIAKPGESKAVQDILKKERGGFLRKLGLID